MGSRRRNFAAFLLDLTAKNGEFFAKGAKCRAFGECPRLTMVIVISSAAEQSTFSIKFYHRGHRAMHRAPQSNNLNYRKIKIFRENPCLLG